MTTRGGAREKNGRFYAHARYGKKQRVEVRVPWAKTLDQALERAELVARAAEGLAQIGRIDLVRAVARDIAAASTSQRLGRVMKALEATLKGAIVAPSHDITFRQWATRYTSGELARLYPDDVKLRDYSDDVSRLKKYILKLVGDVPVVRFEMSNARSVMAALPPMSEANRRQVAQIMGRLMHLAVNPGALLKASPLPRGWLPKVTKRRHYSCLLPLEEKRFLACEDIPEEFRLFCGVLDREGMRLTQLLDSDWWQWGDVGTFTSTKTKTGDPHLVAIRPDTARAMRDWRERQKRAGRGDRKPFAGVLELVKDKTKIAEYYRAQLLVAGVDRKELHESTEHTGMLRAHDMRATFVTVSLAEGKSETWIRDRTSHKSTAMIDRYRRMARQYAELELGSLCDLGEAMGWWKPGGKPSKKTMPKESVTIEKCPGEDSNLQGGNPAEPKFGRGSDEPPDGPQTRRKATPRDVAKSASTTLPPPSSQHLATDSADQERDGQSIAHADGPGPRRTAARAQGPVTAAEERLRGAQRGAAALALETDVLEEQVDRLARRGGR